MEKKKPNIVFLLSDHQAYYRHGEEGVSIHRPTFDKIASEGALFTNAYSACPLCGPVRRTILTGLYPHTHREIHNDVNIPFGENDTYLDVLANNGYKNYYYGKWHAGPGTAYDHQCEGYSYPSYNNPYLTEEYQKYLKENNLPKPEIYVEHNLDFKRPFIKEGEIYEQKQNWSCEVCSGIMLTPKETHEAFFLAHLACQKIDEIGKQHGSTPFSLRVDFWGPHQPYFVTKEFADMYKPEDIPEYPSFGEDVYHNNKPEIYQVEPTAQINQDNHIIYPNPLPWSTWQEIIARCYAQITMVDAASKMIYDALERNGLLENTIFICSTDHGDAVGSHGGRMDKGCYMTEEILRIPLVVRFPEKIAANSVIHRPVSSADIPVTILDAAGLQFGHAVHGKSLLQNQDKVFGYAVSETHGHKGIKVEHFARAITNGRYKYVYNRDQIEEFYDLRIDPYEMKNLINISDYTDQIKELRNQYLSWAESTGDQEGIDGVCSLING